MAGGKQSTSPSRSQQGFALCAYSVSVVLGTALLLRFVVPKFSLLSERAPADASAVLAASDGCCPDLLQELAATMNESVDPCDDFVRYACGDMEQRIRRRDYEDSWFHSHLWLPALTGEAKDEASALLRKVYLSCARNDFRPKSAFADAGAALHEALNLISTDALGIPALIVRVTASFRIKLFIRVSFVQARTAPQLQHRRVQEGCSGHRRSGLRVPTRDCTNLRAEGQSSELDVHPPGRLGRDARRAVRLGPTRGCREER
ncbi:hypothetical protein MTO96_000142 [Rhipicephalus appendiculatus]